MWTFYFSFRCSLSCCFIRPAANIFEEVAHMIVNRHKEREWTEHAVDAEIKKTTHLWLSLAVLSNFDLMWNNAIKVNDVHHLLLRCLSANSLELADFRVHKTQYQPTHYDLNIHIDNIKSLCAQEFDGKNAKNGCSFFGHFWFKVQRPFPTKMHAV